MATCGAAPASATMRSARAVRRRIALRHHETAEIVGLGDGRRQADAGELRREAKQPRQAKREQIAALRGHQRMQLVENDAPERAEQIRRVGGSEQQRELLRRRQQDIRRIAALALAFRGRRIAGARLDADRQPHFGDRRFEIARDIDGQRLQRRNVERVQARRRGARRGRWRSSFPRLRSAIAAQLCERGDAAPLNSTKARQKSRQRLAAAGRRDQQHRAAGLRLGQKLQLMRARRPAAAGEPARKRLRAVVRAFENGHAPELMGRLQRSQVRATTTRPSTGTPFSLRTAAWRDARPQGRRQRATARR